MRIVSIVKRPALIWASLAALAAGPMPQASAEMLEVRGVIRALAESTVAMDYVARIRKMPKREGEAFRTGDVLIAFDCRRYVAEVAAARAGARAKELVAVKNRKLLARGAVASSDVQVSDAELAHAQAEVTALQSRTGSCDFKAPFDGLLVERLAQEHEIPAANQPLIRIVDTSRLELEAIMPSASLAWLKPGQAFRFRIDETGATVDGEIVRLGAVVDPVSQTIKAYGVLATKDPSVLPGMSGTATFPDAGS
jgi:membrane fusion protein, multidrug efflux system